MKYYLHDTSAFSDEKITQLYMQFGFEGLGLFYTILERLARWEKPMQEDVLKQQLYIGKRLQKQLSFMYKIGILSLKNGEVFSETLLNFAQKYQIKKEKTRIKVAEWRAKQADVTSYVPVTLPLRNHLKVNKSKVKRSKDIIYTEKFEYLWSIYPEREGRKLGKSNAFKNYNKLELKNGDLEKLESAIKNYNGQQYPKDMERFLKDGFWLGWVQQIEEKNEQTIRDKAEELLTSVRSATHPS